MKYSTRDLNRPAEELGTMTVVARRPQLVQRSCPTAEIYDIEAILARRRVPALLATASEVAKTSGFFQQAAKRRNSDPFQRRLSKLT